MLVAQLCPTHCNPTKSSRPGSSVHGILQARILEWIPFSNTQGRLPKKLINLFLFSFWLPLVFFAVCGRSAGGESGVYSLSVAVRASYCGGVFCCRARALGVWVSASYSARAHWLWSMGLVALSMWDPRGLGTEPSSSALAGKVLTLNPQGSPQTLLTRAVSQVLEYYNRCSQNTGIVTYVDPLRQF